MLDAPLSLEAKIAVARAAGRARSRATRRPGAAGHRGGLPRRRRSSAGERPALAALRGELEEELDRGATQAFSGSFLAAALLALLAAGAAFAAMMAARSARGSPASSNGSTVARLAVAVPGAAVVAALLVAVHVALGGGDFGPRAVADPCGERARPAGRRAHAARGARDARRRRLRAAVRRARTCCARCSGSRRPAGVGEDELADAFVAGVDRAQSEGALGGLEAAALKFGLRAGALTGILGLLLPGG